MSGMILTIAQLHIQCTSCAIVCLYNVPVLCGGRKYILERKSILESGCWHFLMYVCVCVCVCVCVVVCRTSPEVSFKGSLVCQCVDICDYFFTARKAIKARVTLLCVLVTMFIVNL